MKASVHLGPNYTENLEVYRNTNFEDLQNVQETNICFTQFYGSLKADAASAYTQVKIEDAPRLLKIPQAECPYV